MRRLVLESSRFLRLTFLTAAKTLELYEFFSGSSRGLKVTRRTIIVSVVGLQKTGYENVKIINLGRSRLVYQLVLQSVADKFCIAFHIHLLKHAGAVGADGSNTKKKFFSDRLDRFSCGDHSHDLILSIR